jgi:hypothetical protein
MRRCRNTWSSIKDSVDEDSCFVSKVNCHNNVKKHLDGLLLTPTLTSRVLLEKPTPRFAFGKKGSYHSRRFSLILLHTFPSVYSLSQYQHPLDLETHTASAFSSSRQLCATSQDPPMPIA